MELLIIRLTQMSIRVLLIVIVAKIMTAPYFSLVLESKASTIEVSLALIMTSTCDLFLTNVGRLLDIL